MAANCTNSNIASCGMGERTLTAEALEIRMGLKMPTDEDILANKIFLNRASVRNKAKSWLTASSGGQDDQTSSPSQTKTSQQEVENDLRDIRASDELSGVGVVSKSGEDDPTNRQLMSANDALRRKLLSREAYKRYSDSKRRGADASRPVSKKREHEEEDEQDDEGGKGRSIRSAVMQPLSKDDSQVDGTDSGPAAAPTPTSRNKKRSRTYLDQLLAERKGRKQKKAKKSDSND